MGSLAGENIFVTEISTLAHLQSITERYLSEEEENQSEFEELLSFIDENNIMSNRNTLLAFSSYISHMSLVRSHMKNDIQKRVLKIIDTLFTKYHLNEHFEQITIFNVFNKNKNTLLYLHQHQKINIVNLFSRLSYAMKRKIVNYFLPEMKAAKVDIDDYIKDNQYIKTHGMKQVEKNKYSRYMKDRNGCHSEDPVAQLIRNDDIDEFIKYITNEGIEINSTIESSGFEINDDLNQSLSLIEYASAFGSVKIFKYLLLNTTELSSSLLRYAIIGENSEIITLLEEKNFEYDMECLCIALKYHTKLSYYTDKIPLEIDLVPKYLQNYNFDLLQNKYKVIFKKEIIAKAITTSIKEELISVLNFIFKQKTVDINDKVVENTFS
ncbi:hypothetical protein TRFO_42289 [Tritrichomonas foetus]|uniref:DUF3447 domain-containing protein n=1 Tax=Tritrichomonas foetus TaxID=1144522 RepID=A0A1J4L1I0_9EUKA|nr:hypothetical protein TRFO_42289 [Tritrichomonas foetus]|eukprot:OHT15814.1 hypothetical protein TRFO_42289 [Tritrichomonas foetus]